MLKSAQRLTIYYVWTFLVLMFKFWLNSCSKIIEMKNVKQFEKYLHGKIKEEFKSVRPG